MPVPRAAITGAVEGPTDEAELRRLVKHLGGEVSAVHGGLGKAHLRERIHGYNTAARRAPWVVLVDLDHDAACGPELVNAWLPEPSPGMCLRVVVREVEAWLLADRERLSDFLSVAASNISPVPEALPDPKRTLVELASRSRRRDIREDMVPRPESGRQVGPAYASRIVQFVSDVSQGWRPDVAAASCDSLRRCLGRLRELVGGEQRRG